MVVPLGSCNACAPLTLSVAPLLTEAVKPPELRVLPKVVTAARRVTVGVLEPLPTAKELVPLELKLRLLIVMDPLPPKDMAWP